MSQRKDTNSGLWYYYGVVPGTKNQYKKRGFKTKRDAKEAEDAFRKSIGYGVDHGITLDKIVKMYAENQAGRSVKESTLVGDEAYYNNHIKERLGKMKVVRITAPVVSAWQTELSMKKKPDGSLYAARTINHAKNVLSKYLTYAVEKGYITSNPCRDVKSIRTPEVMIDKVINFWEYEEFKYFIRFVDDQYWNDVFTFMYATGVREGELFALQWKDINFVIGTCNISKSITNKTKSKKYKITTPKNRNSVRVIDLQKNLCEMLKRRYIEQSKKDGFKNSYFVFGDITPLSRSHLARHLDYYINLSGVTRITPHGFRHSHVSYLVNNGVDDSLIAERLGHTVSEMRETYTHIYKSARRSMKDILDNI